MLYVYVMSVCLPIPILYPILYPPCQGCCGWMDGRASRSYAKSIKESEDDSLNVKSECMSRPACDVYSLSHAVND